MTNFQFEKASNAVTEYFKKGGETSNDNKLKLYANFKQATVGDCNTGTFGLAS